MIDAARRPPGIQSCVIGRILILCTSECQFLAIGFLPAGGGDDPRSSSFVEAYMAGSDTPIELDSAFGPPVPGGPNLCPEAQS